MGHVFLGKGQINSITDHKNDKKFMKENLEI